MEHLKCQVAIAKETRGQKVKRFERMQWRVAARPDPKIPTTEQVSVESSGFPRTTPPALVRVSIRQVFFLPSSLISVLLSLYFFLSHSAVSPHLPQSSSPPFSACKKPKKSPLITSMKTRAAADGGDLHKVPVAACKCSIHLPVEVQHLTFDVFNVASFLFGILKLKPAQKLKKPRLVDL